MQWTKVEINMQSETPFNLHVPPSGRALVSKVLGDNAPSMFQRDSDGNTLNGPPSIIYGGAGNHLTISGIGKTGAEVLDGNVFDVLSGLQREHGSLPSFRKLSGEFPDELELFDHLVTYRIPRLIMPTKSKGARAIWFGGKAKEHAPKAVDKFFRDRLDQLGIEAPENLLLGDVKFARTIPIERDGFYNLALADVTFRTNANLKLRAGTPWNIGKLTSFGFGVILPGKVNR
jgi:hypothetical protein